MKTLLPLAFAALLAAPAFAARDYTVLDLGTLGGPGSYGAAIADDGTVVGCADVSAVAAHAFIWQGGTMRDLGTGGDASAAGSSCALALNERGQVAGRATNGEIVVWAVNGAVTRLGVQGDVGGINDAGTVVGAYRDAGATRAFVFSRGMLQPIAVPGDAASSSAALGINKRGEVVGRTGARAFLYGDRGIEDLGAGTARAINDRGVIVGQSADGNAQPTAVVYGRGAIPAPAYSTAVAVNNRGQVVGTGEGIHGWLVDAEGFVRLDQLPAVIAKGFRRVEPTGINEQGWIVATASNADGNLRAIVLVPPEGPKGKPLRLLETASAR